MGIKKTRVDMAKFPVPRQMTTGEIGELFDVAPRTVTKWTDSGKLPHVRIPGSLDRRVEVGDLIRFAKKHGYDTQADFLLSYVRPDIVFVGVNAEVITSFKPLLLAYNVSIRTYDQPVEATASIVRRPAAVLFAGAWIGKAVVGAMYRLGREYAESLGWVSRLVVVTTRQDELGDWTPESVGVDHFVHHYNGRVAETMAVIMGQLPVRMEEKCVPSAGG